MPIPKEKAMSAVLSHMALVAATVIGGNGGDLLPASTVLIEGTSIVAVGQPAGVTAGA
jgi:hypothetical protein